MSDRNFHSLCITIIVVTFFVLCHKSCESDKVQTLKQLELQQAPCMTPKGES